ncbi:hypothetical protein WA158_004736 [Blastocystis sp. Blastoise]
MESLIDEVTRDSNDLIENDSDGDDNSKLSLPIKRDSTNLDTSGFGSIRSSVPTLFQPASKRKRDILNNEKTEIHKRFSFSSKLLSSNETSNKSILERTGSSLAGFFNTNSIKSNPSYLSTSWFGKKVEKTTVNSYNTFPRDMSIKNSFRIFSQYSFPDHMIHLLNSLTHNNVYNNQFTHTTEQTKNNIYKQDEELIFTYNIFPLELYNEEIIAVLNKTGQMQTRINTYISSYISISSIYLSQYNYLDSETLSTESIQPWEEPSVPRENYFYVLSNSFSALFTSTARNIPVCILYIYKVDTQQALKTVPFPVIYPYKQEKPDIVEEDIILEHTSTTRTTNNTIYIAREEMIGYIYGYRNVYKAISWMLNHSSKLSAGMDIPTLLSPSPFSGGSIQTYTYIYRGDITRNKQHYYTLKFNDIYILPTFIEALTNLMIKYLKTNIPNDTVSNNDILLFELEYTANPNSLYFNIPQLGISDVTTGVITCLKCYLRCDDSIYYIPDIKSSSV